MSKKLNEADIDKLSALARLSVSEEERVSLAKDIESILSYVSELDSVSIKVADRKKESLRNITREDEVTDISEERRELILKSAPKLEDGYVVVKKVL